MKSQYKVVISNMLIRVKFKCKQNFRIQIKINNNNLSKKPKKSLSDLILKNRGKCQGILWLKTNNWSRGRGNFVAKKREKIKPKC